MIGAWFGWCGMHNEGQIRDIGTLPLTGIAGFLLTKHIATLIDRSGGEFARSLTYIGDNTLYILIFHTLSFKIISALKIWWYGLDPKQIGCHMVVHFNSKEDAFWILYAVIGVGVPLLLVWIWREYIEQGIERILARKSN